MPVDPGLPLAVPDRRAEEVDQAKAVVLTALLPAVRCHSLAMQLGIIALEQLVAPVELLRTEAPDDQHREVGWPPPVLVAVPVDQVDGAGPSAGKEEVALVAVRVAEGQRPPSGTVEQQCRPVLHVGVEETPGPRREPAPCSAMNSP